MDQQEKGKDNMHKNLIKVNEMLAFAKNSEGVISLLLKKTKNYSFEDIINKEREIDELYNNIKKLNIEKDNAKATKTGSRILLLILFAFLMFIIYISVSFHIIIGAILLLVQLGILGMYKQEGFGIKEAIKPKDTKEIEEELEKAKELLNTKKEELERILNQVDFREYSNKEEIESIISNMLNITPSNEYSNTVNNDLSNTQTLDGPSRERRK